ncbi:response regulator transcription factor [Diaphorobacter caeni]|uniref:response regulator transcription factor n=1 Tax=Diaphorobacter caeni TaxID=2784387 RepID=UPI00188FB4E1|nr:response regulator transcription factor [Diaphorobacter caeni]MBF5004288.1 response regulator transcription factor [Diaphorobacter caeni]
MNKIRVAIADDHPTVLYALGNLIQQDSRFMVVATLKSSTELIRFLRDDAEVDIVITDFTMPDDGMYGDGVRYIKYLLRNFPGRRFVVYSDCVNASMVFSLYDYGVAAVVLKNHELAELGQALNRLVDGGVYYPPGINREDLRMFTKNLHSISPRELEVLRQFSRGLPLKTIAADLNRSIKTVSTQKRSVMRKLDIATDQLLMEFCLNANLF